MIESTPHSPAVQGKSVQPTSADVPVNGERRRLLGALTGLAAVSAFSGCGDTEQEKMSSRLEDNLMRAHHFLNSERLELEKLEEPLRILYQKYPSDEDVRTLVLHHNSKVEGYNSGVKAKRFDTEDRISSYTMRAGLLPLLKPIELKDGNTKGFPDGEFKLEER